MAYLFFRSPNKYDVPTKICKFIGIFVSHVSMAALMIAGAVDYHLSTTTLLTVKEGEEEFIGRSDEDVVIEVYEIKDGKETNVNVIKNKYISNMILNGKVSVFNFRPDKKTFKFEGKPFSLEFEGWYRNCNVFSVNRATHKDTDNPAVDGLFLREDEILTHSESDRIAQYNQSVSEQKRKKFSNMAGCYVTVKMEDGKSRKLILWSSMGGASTLVVDGKVYGFRIDYRRQVLPFKIALKELDVQKYQGTMQARDYVSHVKYEVDQEYTDTTISMNKPFRNSGFTVYQARWDRSGVDLDKRDEYVKAQKAEGGDLDFADNHKLTSVYQIVSNPADRWPEYCVYIAGLGLSFHFLIKLCIFVSNSFERRGKDEK